MKCIKTLTILSQLKLSSRCNVVSKVILGTYVLHKPSHYDITHLARFFFLFFFKRVVMRLQFAGKIFIKTEN